MGSLPHPEGHSSLEPLAVIGMSFRFPAGAEDVDTFWDMLVSKRSASRRTPPDRFNVDAHHHSGSHRIGSMSYEGGNFLEGDPVNVFDAPFFSIGAAEAQAMDPVHRLALETAYRALENAGLSMEKVAGSKTAVFAGSSSTDYSTMMSKDPLYMAKYTATGTSSNMMANRVSWFFDLTGPSAGVSAACSSSLVALDMTCQSIWAGNSTMGLACGGNVILAPEGGMWLDNLGMLSKDSQCFSLDKQANGFARGEGCGVIVIKPISAALRDNDTIRAVIRATHSNSNGRTAGLTQPSHDAQYRLILDTYAKAGLSLAATRYFEAHGTGTSLGDPTECGAIGAAFSPYRSSEEPLYVGSVKSNIGHLEGASGVAGVIKAILALEAGVIPPNAKFTQMNPSIDAKLLKIAVAENAIPWPTQGLRRASVQSFGFGGSNSHVILDDASTFLRTHGLSGVHNTVSFSGDINGHVTNNFDGRESKLAKLLVWSSEDEGGIARMKHVWKRYFDSPPLARQTTDQNIKHLEDLAYTLGSRRSHLSWRSFAVATDVKAMTNLIDRMATPIRVNSEPRLAFIFTGQGSQWFAMGRELIERYEVFHNSLLDAGTYFRSLGCPWNVIDELRKDESHSKVNDAFYSQPLCTALQVALVELLESFGIRPTAVVGHSSGEIAAAYSAGAISRRSAWKLAYWRGALAAQLAQASPMKGGMLAVGLSPEAISKHLDAVETELGSRRLVVACVNSPTSVTISGDSAHLDRLQTLLDRVGGILNRRLRVDVAYHSSQMQEIADEYVKKVGYVEPGLVTPDALGKQTVVMASSVTGSRISVDQLCLPQYWVQNLVSPVLFSDAVTSIANFGSQDERYLTGMLEIGPHSALQAPIKEILHDFGKPNSTTYIPLLVRRVSAVQTLLEAVGHLHCLGFATDLSQVNSEITEKKLQGRKQALKSLSYLPEYPFNHTKSYWHESRASRGYRFRRFGWHELVGVPDSDWNPLEAKWRHVICPSDQPWVEDHQINGTIVFPAAGMFVMVIEAARQLADPARKLTGFMFKNTTFHSVFKFPAGALSLESNLHMRPRTRRGKNDKDAGWYDFRIYTHDVGMDEWQEKCYGSVQLIYAPDKDSQFDEGREAKEWNKTYRLQYIDARRSCNIAANAGTVYDGFRELGYGYGPAFRAITTLAHNGHDLAVAEVQTHRDPGQTKDHVIHPATLDCIFQVMFMAVIAGGTKKFRLAVPSHFDSLWISSEGLSYPSTERVQVSGTARRTGLRKSCASIVAVDSTADRVLLQIDGFRTTDVASDQGAIVDEQENSGTSLCHNIHWKPDLSMMSAEQIQQFCDASMLSGTGAAHEPIDFFTDVDFLINVYIKRTLSTITPGDIKAMQVKHHTRMYLAWMKHKMELLHVKGSPFNTPEWKSHLEDETYITRVEGRVAATNPSGVLYTTVGTNIEKLLRGEINPLDMLFHGDLVKAHYYGTWESLPAVQRFRCFLDAHVHKDPGVNILEIGAGTGATTAQLMKILTTTHVGGEPCAPRFARFDYTDVSPFFFEAAEQQYRNLGSRIRFKKLDIERDPKTQGFVEGSYDIIVAASVLHATTDIARTLKHCRWLLKSGGKLILWENTVPDGLRTNFVFGLLEGWWLASEPYRKWSPCLDENKWSDELEKTGFSGTEVMLRDYDSDLCHEFSIIVSTAIPKLAPISPSTKKDIEVLVVYEPRQKALAQSLKTTFEMDKDPLPVRLSSVENAMRHLGGCGANTRTFCVSLLELDQPILHGLAPELFCDLQKLLTATYKVLWVNRDDDPAYSLIDGLSRVINSEIGSTTLSRLSLKVKTQAHQEHAHLIVKLSKKLLASDDTDTEYAEDENGALLIPRLLSPQTLNAEIKQRTVEKRKVRRAWKDGDPLRLAIGSPGLLDTLHFVEDEGHDQLLQPLQVEIEARSVGLNFKDVLVSLGWLNEQNLGCEVAGVVTRLGASAQRESGLRIGDRVASLAGASYSNFVCCDWRSVAKIPDGIDFSSAAAVPVNFVTAWHAFNDIAHLQRDETVLIHSAAGGTGQAAIQLARHFGAIIYATVGSEHKKTFLMEHYGIPADHIFSSRDVSFASGIRRLTHNKGIDVVLNSLSGNGLVASWECIAPYGRFVEIGKKDITAHGNLPMTMFENNVSFAAIDISMINRDRPSVAGKALQQILALVAKGSLSPAHPLQLYGVSELQKAFRTLQSGKTSGKIVVEMRPDDVVEVISEPKPSCSMDSNATYVIAGGLGGLGRSVASWFVKQGARHLILLSRSGGESHSAERFVRKLRSQGAHVETPACDITSTERLRDVIDSCLLDMPPIKGCIQASMVLQDAPFETMTYDSWQKAIAPKVAGSYNLHTVLPRGMDFFVMFSSIAGVCGSRGQGNYAAGNTFQDSLARFRIARGERATALDLGPFYEVGWMTDKTDLQALYRGITDGPVTEADLHALLDYFCNQAKESPLRNDQQCQTVVLRVAAKKQTAFYLEKPMFRCLAMNTSNSTHENERIDSQWSSTTMMAKRVDFAGVFSSAETLSLAAEAVTEALTQKMAATLSLERDDLDTETPIRRYGVDSLVAVELRAWLAKEVRADVAILDFMGSATIAAIGKMAASKSKFRKVEWTS